MSDIWQTYVKRPVTGFEKMFGKPSSRASTTHQLKIIFQRKDGLQAIATLPKVSQAMYASEKRRKEAIQRLRELIQDIPNDALVVDAYLQTPIGWYRVKDGKLHHKPFPPVGT